MYVMAKERTEDFSLLTEEPDLSTWQPSRWFDFINHSRRNGGYGSVMSDIVWGKNKELVGKKFAKIPGLPFDDMESIHTEVYGNTPRRISCQTALAKTAFTPFLWCHVVNAPSPEEDMSILVEGDTLVHFHETEETLYVGAWQLSEKTWISMPARALLDSAYYDCGYRVLDWLIMALRIATFDTEEIIEISEYLGAEDAIRRICSIGRLIARSERDDMLWLKRLDEYAMDIGKEAICISNSFTEDEIYWHDDIFDVYWNINPREVTDYCYGVGYETK